MIFAILGIVLGIVVGMVLPITYSSSYAIYMSMAILACLDTVLGGVRAMIEEKFDTGIFVSGFFGNAILAVFLTYIGEILGVPLYYAGIFAFGTRLFQNFASIRRLIFEKFRKREYSFLRKSEKM